MKPGPTPPTGDCPHGHRSSRRDQRGAHGLGRGGKAKGRGRLRLFLLASVRPSLAPRVRPTQVSVLEIHTLVNFDEFEWNVPPIGDRQVLPSFVE